MIGGVALRVTSPVLVGRVAEAAQLWAAFERAVAGSPATVVVAGEAGVGKTRLVSELLARARARGAGAGRRLPGRGRGGGRLRADGGGAAPARRAAGAGGAGAGACRRASRAGPAGARAGRARRVSILTRRIGRGRDHGRARAGPAIRAAAGGAAPAGRARRGAAGGRGPALGRPVHQEPAGLPGPQSAGRGGAGADLLQ